MESMKEKLLDELIYSGISKEAIIAINEIINTDKDIAEFAGRMADKIEAKGMDLTTGETLQILVDMMKEATAEE